MLAAQEAPSPADEQKAIEKLKAAMAELEAEHLLRFTTHDIPVYAEEPLCLIAASLAGSDFERAIDPSWASQGMTMIARAVHNGTVSTVSTCYF